MKKLKKQKAAAAPVAEVVPEEISALELLHPGKVDKRAVLRIVRSIDLKKAGIFAGGAAVIMSAVSLSGRYSFYKGIVAGELKRQLGPVNKKLDEVLEQNEELKAEIERLKKEQK